MPFRTPGAAVTLAAAAVVLLSPPAAQAALLAPPPTAGTAAGGRVAQDADWSAAPAGGGGSERPVFYLEGAAGTILRDTLSLTNPTGHPVTVALHGAVVPTIWSPGASGGGRVTPASSRVTVPARTRADVPFTVTVPADAPPGERTGAIVATAGGREERRVGVQLRITGPALSALSVEEVSVARTDAGAQIHYALVNRGTTTLAPRLAVRADGLFGEVLRRGPRALPVELLPGQRMRLSERWPGAPRLDSVEVTLTATAAGGARGSASAPYTAVPWGAAGPLLGAGAAAGGLLVWRRRRAGLPDEQAERQRSRAEGELTEVRT